MTIDELLPPGRVFRLRAGDKGAALSELAKRCGSAVSIPLPEVSAALAAREALGSTGVGSGIAVPHARLAGLQHLAAFFTRLERPVDWAAIDGKPVDLVFLLLSPAQAGSEHLAALAAATRRLRDSDVAQAVRLAEEPEAIRAALVG